MWSPSEYPFSITINGIVATLGKEDPGLAADDADDLLEYLSPTYAEWFPKLVEIALNEKLDVDLRLWAFDAARRVAPSAEVEEEFVISALHNPSRFMRWHAAAARMVRNLRRSSLRQRR